MNEGRPNPDELLAAVQADESNARRGSLKIFFGYAAGVGKTFSMLENAQRAKAAGRDVVVGYVEPHARPDTQALLHDLERLPTKELEYRGVTLREFDVDAALLRHPDLILVDELAHTNAVGSRHIKRWQDVEDLLATGIHVWTTLNVQHIESLNDIVGQITGVVVRETVPDHVFELADELELVDLSPDELLERLSLGKIYLPDQAQRAIQSFFQKANLSALREMSLRRAASRIHSDVESARKLRSDSKPWATADRLLVCVGPSPSTARVIRTAKRMATALDAQWLAVSVDMPGGPPQSHSQLRLAQHFRLAERLGAETLTLSGDDVASTILEYARSRNVTKICIGKTSESRWKRLLKRTVVDQLLESSGEIDVYVIHGERDHGEGITSPQSQVERVNWIAYTTAVGIIVTCGLVATGLRRLLVANPETNTAMIFLAGVAFVAFRFGKGPAAVACLLAVLVFDFFFVPPFLTFAVSDTQYIVTFGVMLAIGLLISTLASRLKVQVINTRKRERRTATLYELGRQLSSISGRVFLVSAASAKISEMINGEVAVYMLGPSGKTEIIHGQDGDIGKHSVSLPAAQWVIDHSQLAGAGTNTLPNACAVFIPLVGTNSCVGALAIRPKDDNAKLLEPEQRQLLEACASQLALALERDQLAIDAAESRIQAEAEQVRSTLLSSVSHDLKTPLAAIAGASSTLLSTSSLDELTRRQLLETVSNEAARLNRLLENILQMSKLDAGAIAPNMQWHVLEEIVGSALHRTRHELTGHPVTTRLPADLPLLYLDGILMEQLLINLLENAAKYTSVGTQVTISANIDSGYLRLVVGDDGPGIPEGMEERIFEKFYRATQSPDDGRGSGLGLAICRAIAKVHQGTITASRRQGSSSNNSRLNQGLEFLIRIPIAKNTPQVPLE